ncbi:hypothetical protein R6Z07M_005921 [Ovis aries]
MSAKDARSGHHDGDPSSCSCPHLKAKSGLTTGHYQASPSALCKHHYRQQHQSRETWNPLPGNHPSGTLKPLASDNGSKINSRANCTNYSAGVPAGTCHRWPRPRTPPAWFPLLQKLGRKHQGTPCFPPNIGRGKEKRTGKPACQEREKGPEPSHCSSKLGSPLRSLRTRPRERSSPGRRRNSAALARGPPIELACSLAASARPSAVPAPQSPNRVRDPGRARPRPRRVHPPASLSPAPWYPGSGPSSRSPLAPAQVPAGAELRLPARPEPLERTLAPARNKEVGGALPAPVPGRAAARSVPRGDGRSRQGSEQRKQRAGGPVLLARGRARRRAPSRRHGQSPPPRPGRPVTWPHRPNNAARSRRAPGPVRLWDLLKLARWNRELLDPLSSPDSECSGGWCVPDGQAIS